ncbi:hypothetical protein MMC08_005414 [Hypocenomyce scalaris]|nr:hypothetical protein [Hypocenomyce scalaris]
MAWSRSRPRVSGLIDERLRLVFRSASPPRLRSFLSEDESEVYDNEDDLDLLRLLRSTPLWEDMDKGSLFSSLREVPSGGAFVRTGEAERDGRVEMVETELDE